MSVDWTAKVGRVLQKMRPDVIHVSSPGFLVFGAILWSRLFGIPLVMSYHTHLPAYVRNYYPNRNKLLPLQWMAWQYIRMIHAFADLTVVTSPQIQQEFKDHKIGRVQVWQKGIDTDKFNPRFRSDAMRDKMTNGHRDSFLMTYIGRLGKEKRLEDLRQVLRSMPDDTRLCLVAAGAHEQELRKYFADDERCVFTGQLDGEELSQAFASADVFCMPSDSETLGFVVLESMASGVPVIGAKAGGVQDLINDGITGFLVEPGDTRAFVDRCNLFRKDQKLRDVFSENGRIEMKRWSWHASMEKLRTEQYVMAQQNFQKRWSQRVWKILTFRWARRERLTPIVVDEPANNWMESSRM